MVCRLSPLTNKSPQTYTSHNKTILFLPYELPIPDRISPSNISYQFSTCTQLPSSLKTYFHLGSLVNLKVFLVVTSRFDTMKERNQKFFPRPRRRQRPRPYLQAVLPWTQSVRGLVSAGSDSWWRINYCFKMSFWCRNMTFKQFLIRFAAQHDVIPHQCWVNRRNSPAAPRPRDHFLRGLKIPNIFKI